MILVRDVFRVHFGQMKPALATIQELSADLKAAGNDFPVRFLTDRTGPFYTLVLEMEFPDLASYEKILQAEMAREEWQKWYKSFVPYLKDGQREIYNIVAG